MKVLASLVLMVALAGCVPSAPPPTIGVCGGRAYSIDEWPAYLQCERAARPVRSEAP